MCEISYAQKSNIFKHFCSIFLEISKALKFVYGDLLQRFLKKPGCWSHLIKTQQSLSLMLHSELLIQLVGQVGQDVLTMHNHHMPSHVETNQGIQYVTSSLFSYYKGTYWKLRIKSIFSLIKLFFIKDKKYLPFPLPLNYIMTWLLITN